MGFSVSITQARCHPSYGALTITPAGLLFPLNTQDFSGRTKIILQGELPYFGLHSLNIRFFFLFLFLSEHACCILLQLPLLFCNLVRMYFELCGEFRDRFIALKGCQGDFGFE